MQQNNPYGFHIQNEANASQPAYQNTGTQYQNTGTQFQNAGASYYGPMDAESYTVRQPFPDALSPTERKKKALVTSLAIMCVGLLISTVSAFASIILIIIDQQLLMPLLIGSLILEISMLFATTSCINKNKIAGGIICYTLFAISNGVMLFSIFFSYSFASIISMFLITTLVFGATTIVALVIPKDLSGWSFSLISGLFALLGLGIINLFVNLPALDLFICVLGIILFIAITAYDIQKISKMAVEDKATSVWSIGLFGGMNLYLDFINMLLKFLRLFGRRK